MLTQKQLGEKIKRLRKEKDLSQEELSKHIGISRTSLSELERGNRSLEAFELAKIAEVFQISTDDLLKEKRKIKGSRWDGKINKDISFNPKKLHQLILYILSKCGGKPNFGETVLYKLLYFMDFDSYELIGTPITGMNYVHQKFGPIPQLKQYKPIIKNMAENKEIKIFNQDYYGMSQRRYVALKNYSVDSFSSREKELIDNTIRKLSDMGAREIEEYAHGDVPWQSTKDNEIIPYNLAMYRKLPYAKRDYDEAWQDSAGKDSLESMGDMPDEEYNYYKNL